MGGLNIGAGQLHILFQDYSFTQEKEHISTYLLISNAGLAINNDRKRMVLVLLDYRGTSTRIKPKQNACKTKTEAFSKDFMDNNTSRNEIYIQAYIYNLLTSAQILPLQLSMEYTSLLIKNVLCFCSIHTFFIGASSHVNWFCVRQTRYQK